MKQDKPEPKTRTIAKRVPNHITQAVWAQIDELFNDLYNELTPERQQAFKKLHKEKMDLYNEVFK